MNGFYWHRSRITAQEMILCEAVARRKTSTTAFLEYVEHRFAMID